MQLDKDFPGNIQHDIKTDVTRKTDAKAVSTFSCITLVNDQLDTIFFYFIIRLLQSSTFFEQRRVHHQEVRLY